MDLQPWRDLLGKIIADHLEEELLNSLVSSSE
jgi:hypothetical protein